MVIEPEKMEILIVDDMPSNIKILAETLKSDYNIVSVESGFEVFELMAKKQPDLILLDIMMPDMDGYEVCRKLKSQENTKHIPIIFISAMNDVEDETKGFEVGAVDYITKPFKPVIVRARVRAQLELKDYQMKLENMVNECRMAEKEILKLNQQLENKVSDRTEKLIMAKKEIVKKKYKNELAEISSNALHDVRNILNSVKTSSEAIRGVIYMPLEGLKKANHMLQNHIDDFSSFDPKIGKFFQFYMALEKTVQNETEKAGLHLNRLQEKIGIIEQIIITHQGYGGTDKKESVMINELVDDAFIMKTDLINRHNIKLLKSYHNVPPIYIKKAKFIHVFINLIKNAVEAMLVSSVSEKQLKVTVYSQDNHIFIKIKDNGCGIPPENLDILFSRGYTTKESGNGFGLNSSARYMKELGGELQVESEGEGKGATFTIILPHAENRKLKCHNSRRI